MEIISIIGLGKLGASMTAAFAARGFEVIGLDLNPQFVEDVNRGKSPVQETNLDHLMWENRARIRATSDYEDAVLNSDISFVIVPTPSDERGAFSLEQTAQAFKSIGKALAGKENYHNVVLTSTVLPGSMRQFLLPILEKASGKKAGTDFGLCYSPEFIALGSIIDDFLNPDFTLIGELDERCGSRLEAIYAQVVMNGAPSARMNFENAELTKISINSFVTTKITFANMLAEICENLPGGNVDVVTAALGLDQRIGKKYLKGAISYGGPCFPRDNVALAFMAGQLGVDAGISRETDRLNRSFVEKSLKKLQPLIKVGATVAVLGLAYKPLSHVTEESPGIQIAKKLAADGMRVLAYDPLADKMPPAELRNAGIERAASIEDCLKQSEAVFITTPDAEFARLEAADFPSENMLVVDFWRLLQDKLGAHPSLQYIAAGCGDENLFNHERLRNIWENKTPGIFRTNAKG